MGSGNLGYQRTGHAPRAKGGKNVSPGGRGWGKGGVLRVGTRGHTYRAVPLPGRWSWRMGTLPARRGGRVKNRRRQASDMRFLRDLCGGRG